MAVSEICRDGVRVRLITEDDRLFLEVQEDVATGDGVTTRMPADADVLCAVVRGMTYQLASIEGYCAITRVGEMIRIEFQAGTKKHACEMTIDEFSKLISPMMPMRLRAMLL